MVDFKRVNKKQARVGKRPKSIVYILAKTLTTLLRSFLFALYQPLVATRAFIFIV